MAKTSSSLSIPTAGPDLARAQKLVLELMAIPGKSGEEAEVAQFIRQKLLAAGARPADIKTDDANKSTPLKGNTGNLILKLPGTVKRAPRRMLSAHMDTVPICVGCQPVVQGEFVRSANPATGLGGDDRAGAATILTAALEILERKLPHPPLTFCWFIQEEIGLQGARHLQHSLLGKPAMAFNWDGGSPRQNDHRRDRRLSDDRRGRRTRQPRRRLRRKGASAPSPSPLSLSRICIAAAGMD